MVIITPPDKKISHCFDCKSKDFTIGDNDIVCKTCNSQYKNINGRLMVTGGKAWYGFILDSFQASVLTLMFSIIYFYSMPWFHKNLSEIQFIIVMIIAGYFAIAPIGNRSSPVVLDIDAAIKLAPQSTYYTKFLIVKIPTIIILLISCSFIFSIVNTLIPA